MFRWGAACSASDRPLPFLLDKLGTPEWAGLNLKYRYGAPRLSIVDPCQSPHSGRSRPGIGPADGIPRGNWQRLAHVTTMHLSVHRTDDATAKIGRCDAQDSYNFCGE